MIRDLILKGTEKIIEEGNEQEKTKVGTLRAGTTGLILEDGTIVGQCAGEAWLRFKGVNGKPVDIDKQLMFSGGQVNEDIWLDTLRKVYDGPILCETDIPTCWETDNKIKVTGRPDLVLCENSKAKGENVQPICGVELKQIMSANTAYQVLFKKVPQLKHLLQAAHYSWQVDCPFELWYTNRVIYEAPDWLKFSREFPKPGEALSNFVNYRYYMSGEINRKTGRPIKHKITEQQYYDRLPIPGQKVYAEPAKITPFLQGYKLKLENGRLYYCDAMNDTDVWIRTIITIDGIKRFYNYIATMEDRGVVPPEALNLSPTGDKIGWSYKDYSDLGEFHAANFVGKPLDDWYNIVKGYLSHA